MGAPPANINGKRWRRQPRPPLYNPRTDPHRAELFTQKQADCFNQFLAELEAVGYAPPKEVGVCSTGKRR
jgi:hypothetical protein